MTKKQFIKPVPSLLFLIGSVITAVGLHVTPVSASPRNMIFPVIGSSSFTNDYNSNPDAGRIHRATDIIANKHQKLVSAVNGTIVHVAYPQPNWGYSVTVEDEDGFQYRYIHMNDDHLGTNDGLGGGMNAYAPDVKIGNKVIRGQLLGYVGDSGNSNGIPHLHLDIIRPDGERTNPYPWLTRAKKISRPVTPVTQPNEVLPFGNSKLGLRIAMGNFDGDAASEYVVGAGVGSNSPRVKVYDNNNQLLDTFLAYGSSFSGGVEVATGDFNNDGVDEIITGVKKDGVPRVRVFDRQGTPMSSFYAYDSSFKGGLNLSAGDVDNDNIDEIIAGVGSGGSARVRVFEQNGTPIGGFFAFDTDFDGGVDVASGDVNGDGNDEIIAGAGPGTLPQVKVFELDRTVVTSFTAYASNFRGGVRVSSNNVRLNNVKDEILTVPATKGAPLVKIFDNNANLIDSQYFMEQWWLGYNDIAAGYDKSKASTGYNRRGSVKPAIE